jgi:hypothetical protein
MKPACFATGRGYMKKHCSRNSTQPQPFPELGQTQLAQLIAGRRFGTELGQTQLAPTYRRAGLRQIAAGQVVQVVPDPALDSARTTYRQAGLRQTLVTAAWGAIRTKASYLRAQFLRLKSRRGPKKAIIAVAASMLTAVYYIVRDRVAYQDLGADHFTKRDHAKVARRLVKRLEDLGFAVEARPTSVGVSI